MQLTEFPKRRYSMLEYRVFNMLPKDGSRIRSRDLAAERDEMGVWKAKNKLNIMTVVMANLTEKVKANKEPFRICKEGRYPGHPEVEYWVEPREAKSK
jgi:hypothetical protein